MASQPSPKTEPVAIPNDPSANGKAPDDPANSGAAINTPKTEPGILGRVTETLKEGLDKLVAAVQHNTPAAGTVTVDFGPGGKLTGCLLMGSITAPIGEDVTVMVPTDLGYVQLPIPGQYVTRH